MNEPISRIGTEAEDAEARAIATAMYDAIPDGTDAAMMLAATGFLLETLFAHTLRPQYRIMAFDDFARYTREALMRDSRS